ncbi:MAG: hypothetical protein H0V01_01960 [Bacteroidetes bacterium]|nr:hypothetical protein [Bacteroidota bacterium]HET6243308.1 hypothetical protein [Bacteroidia bacterium]
MHTLKRAVDLLIFSNVFVSLCAACLAFCTKIIFQVNEGFYLEVFVFFSSLAVYNFQRIIPSQISEHALLSVRHKWIANHRKMLAYITIIAFIAASLVFVFWFKNKIESIVLLLPFGFLSVWYAMDMHQILPFLKGRFKKLRGVPYFKIVLIALTWTAVTVWLPIIEYGSDFSNTYIFVISLERMLFLFAITLPFDIRDMKQDEILNVKTIPMILGVEKTKYLSFFLLIVFSFNTLLEKTWFATDPGIITALILSAIITGFVISFVKKENNEYYYSFWIESTMLIQFLLLLVFDSNF